ncbi:MAG: AfsR/SARP family transcriptional regulator, partial [Longimicrobiales bacterium]
MHIRTLGGLMLEAGVGDGPPPELGRRRLALLAVLATAGSRDITREKIIGILWPDTDEKQARHTLSQTLYLMRRETGRPWATGTTLLRLHDSITSDVVQFQDALDTSQLERAATLYGGAFLEGFYLQGAPEFEEWVETTRARLHAAATQALERLARQADAGGQFEQAIRWWRRLGELDPYSAAYAAGRIRALMNAGDDASALHYAREYETRIRRELDAEPAPIIAELIAGIRTAESPSTRQPSPAQHAPVAASAQTVADKSNPLTQTPARSRRATRAAAAMLTLVATAAVAFTIRSAREPAAPYLAIGFIQSRDTAALGPLLRDMLAANLARIEGIKVVTNSRLLELLGRTSENVPGAAANAARRAGAHEIVEGELSLTAAGPVLTLRRVTLQSGVVQKGYAVRAADPYALTDSATVAIARDLGFDLPPGAAATVNTRSAVAYVLYEQGLRSKYAGDGPATHRLMMAALERDSTFAMAAFHAWSYARPDEAARILPLVQRLATKAIDRERLYIQGSLALGHAPQAEALGIARELTSRYPDDPDAQLLLGDGLRTAGEWANAAAAFDRAVAIDSAAGAFHGRYCRLCGVLVTMTQGYLWWDSAAAAERAARRLIAFRPDEAAGWQAAVEPLLRQGRRAEAEAAIARARTLSAIEPNLDWQLDRDLIRSGRLDELEVRLVSKLRTAAPDARGEAPWLLAFVLRNQGRLREAEDFALNGVLPRVGTRLGGHRDHTSLAIVALERGNAREAAQRFLDMVAADRAANTPTGFKARNTTWHMTLAATALAAAGDT